MARTIHEGLGSRRLSLRSIHLTVRYSVLHLPELPGADVLQLHHRLLSLHHQRLYPDHRHLPRLHAPHQLDAHLGILWRARSPRHDLLLGQLKRRHILREACVQGIRRESYLIVFYSSSSSYDPAYSDKTQDTRIHFTPAARSLFVQQQVFPTGRVEKYDRLRSLIRNDTCLLHHLLEMALENLPADRGQGSRPYDRRGSRVVLVVGRMVDARCLIVLGVPEQVVECCRLDSDVRVDLPVARTRCIHQRRTCPDYCPAEIQHKQSQGMRHH